MCLPSVIAVLEGGESMPNYLVTWEIDITDATDEVDAARKARAAQTAKGSIATVFTVYPEGADTKAENTAGVYVDLELVGERT